jgi:hypothetical protein
LEDEFEIFQGELGQLSSIVQDEAVLKQQFAKSEAHLIIESEKKICKYQLE